MWSLSKKKNLLVILRSGSNNWAITSSNICVALNTGRYFDEISQDTGKYCFGVDDTLKALELGAVEILICWENLDIMRYMLKIPGTEATKVLHLTPEQQKDNTHFTDKEVTKILFCSYFNLKK